MDQTPSAVDELRFFVPCLTSFSIGFSSAMGKPAMAESTLVKGTDMLSGSGMAEMWKMRERNQKRERERERGEARQVTWL